MSRRVGRCLPQARAILCPFIFASPLDTASSTINPDVMHPIVAIATPVFPARENIQGHFAQKISKITQGLACQNSQADFCHLQGTKIRTPIQVDRLAHWLQGYDRSETTFLLNGFTNSFHAGFHGVANNVVPKNMKSAYKHPSEVDNHIQKELKANRLAGPFDKPPFTNFQASPIGLVEKKKWYL